MGDAVEPRKQYISEYANFNKQDKFKGNEWHYFFLLFLFGFILDGMAKVAHIFQFHYLAERETHAELILYLSD